MHCAFPRMIYYFYADITPHEVLRTLDLSIAHSLHLHFSFHISVKTNKNEIFDFACFFRCANLWENKDIFPSCGNPIRLLSSLAMVKTPYI